MKTSQIQHHEHKFFLLIISCLKLLRCSIESNAEIQSYPCDSVLYPAFLLFCHAVHLRNCNKTFNYNPFQLLPWYRGVSLGNIVPSYVSSYMKRQNSHLASPSSVEVSSCAEFSAVEEVGETRSTKTKCATIVALPLIQRVLEAIIAKAFITFFILDWHSSRSAFLLI